MSDIRVPVPSEVSLPFLQGMADRMTTSFYKYGPVADAYPTNIDAIASARVRIERYLATGNTEWLMDAANFLMIEFMYPSRAGAHYRPTDAGESPGRAITVPDMPRDASNSDINAELSAWRDA